VAAGRGARRRHDFADEEGRLRFAPAGLVRGAVGRLAPGLFEFRLEARGAGRLGPPDAVVARSVARRAQAQDGGADLRNGFAVGIAVVFTVGRVTGRLVIPGSNFGDGRRPVAVGSSLITGGFVAAVRPEMRGAGGVVPHAAGVALSAAGVVWCVGRVALRVGRGGRRGRVAVAVGVEFVAGVCGSGPVRPPVGARRLGRAAGVWAERGREHAVPAAREEREGQGQI